MNEKQDLKSSIQEALNNFQSRPFVEAAYDFWKVQGYESQRRFEEVSYTYSEFTEAFSSRHQLRDDKALKDHWKQIHILFQLTDEEIRDGLSASSQEEIEGLGFNSIQSQNIKSYLFVAIELEKGQVTRTNLANLTREINRCFAMPVLLLVKTDQTLTISVIYRRRSKKDDAKDVLEKVTLIKDIRFRGSTHRAHIEILFDLSLSELGSKHHLAGFDQLHKAWEQTLDLKELNKKFYKELSNWFFWAVSTVNFPDPDEPDAENRNTIGLIRLLTRIIFVWFMKEKGLVPEDLFDLDKVQKIINFSDGSGSSYYKAILQNLFFATLNTEMTKDKAESRRFRKDITGHLNSDFNLHTVFRYKQMFMEPDTAIKKHFGGIPFLNGSLFECLDSEIKSGDHVQKTYVDGFSDRSDNPLKVPDNLFWNGPGKECDLNEIYGTKNKRYNVRGLLDILHSYKFTIAENTPVEEEVALDPELLGRVFENLLAAYNPETRSTARHETGSFYTPREIVDFMVNESIVAHLCNALPAKDESAKEDNELRLRLLLTYADEDSLFSPEEADILIHAIDNTRIIDPACGSGAFPMGLLLKMVYILHKLDPDNRKWKARQIENLKASASAMQKTISDTKFRDETTKKLQESIRELEKTFEDYDLDYSRKLYLIERCIYGVDIQPIAIQISQLRFFISLLVDQTPKPRRFNLGIEPLPNLETNLIAANSLIPINLGDQREIFFDNEIEQYKKNVMDIHNEYFSAHSRKKKTDLRAREEKLRSDFVQELKTHDIPIKNADLIASWKPYQSHNYAQFFDPEIMFGFKGFDIVIANPPYIKGADINYKTDLKEAGYEVFNLTSDLYTYFYERAYHLLLDKGIVTFITSNKWMSSGYGTKLRLLLGENTTIITLVDFEGFKVFESATVDTNIIVLLKDPPAKNHATNFVNVDSTFTGVDLDSYIFTKTAKIAQSMLKSDVWTLADKSILALKHKIEAQGKPLRDWDIEIYRGVLTGCNEAFLVDTQTKDMLSNINYSDEVFKKLLRGKDINRYRHDWDDLWLIKLDSGWTDDNRGTKDPVSFFSSRYPKIFSYMLQLGNDMKDGRIKVKGKGLFDRGDQGDYWWELRDCAYYDKFENTKIIWADIATSGSFQYDTDGFYINNTAYMITGNHLEYLIGVLNSKIFDFYFRLISSGLSGQASRGFKAFIERFPVPDPADPSVRNQIGKLALKIVDIKKKLDFDKNNDLQRHEMDVSEQINQLVYKVYGLTKSEILLVEKEASR